MSLFFVSDYHVFCHPWAYGMHQTIGAFSPDLYVDAGPKFLLLYPDLVWNLKKLDLIPACKNVSLMLSCLYFQALALDDLGGCGLFCYPSSWVKPPLFPPKHTRIQTTAMTHHSNSSVRDHMKWVSGSLKINANAFLCCLVYSAASPSPDSSSLWGVL